LFQAFQTNLLSLISHELRTPLTGILNSVSLLEEMITGVGPIGAAPPELSQSELITTARQNAQRLHRALATLLDLAALESGSFHARLREVDLIRLVRTRIEAHRALFRDNRLELTPDPLIGLAPGATEYREGAPLLADPNKLARALDLCMEVMAARGEKGSKVEAKLQATRVDLSFRLAAESESQWDAAWSQALAGYHGGVASPSSGFSSGFSGVMQHENAFLTRVEEGLGSELLLVHEIMRVHSGKFTARKHGRELTLSLQLPELSSEEGLRAVLNSRAYEVSSELGSVAIVLVRVPSGEEPAAFARRIKQNLFRSKDAVYALPARMQVAWVLDDCKPQDAPQLLGRVQKAMGFDLTAAIAHCPADAIDPARLLEIAGERLGAMPDGAGVPRRAARA
jgi:hypothetical protein